jgi:guanylate kinase
MARGPLIIVSGPSGVGKSTLVRRLLDEPTLRGRLRLSVSATTRSPRPGEVDGVHYHFWTRERFESGLAAGEFLEHAEVYGNWYGTLRAEVEPYRGEGWGVLLDIDTQGAAQVQAKCPDYVSVFVRASSLVDYEVRLRRRGTETEAAIQRRLAGAREELKHADEYHYQVVNDDLHDALAQLRTIVEALFTRGS